MAQIEKTAKLIRLSDTELTIANPAEDIRGRAAVDRDGEDIGEVEDLLMATRYRSDATVHRRCPTTILT